MSGRHRKTFRAFNGRDAWDEEKTKDAGDYEGRHRRSEGLFKNGDVWFGGEWLRSVGQFDYELVL